MMGERHKKSGRDIHLPSGEQAAAAREHERTLRMLKRLADVLDRPIEDFFQPGPEAEATAAKADRDERE